VEGKTGKPDLKATVDKRLVQIQNETFPSGVVRRHRGEKRPWYTILKVMEVNFAILGNEQKDKHEMHVGKNNLRDR
jgi:hypothetical protein